MPDYQSGQNIVTTLTGSELVSIDTGGAEVAACTTGAIADLASAVSNNTAITALNTVGAGTITAAGILGGILSRGGAQSGSSFTDTTATALLIVAALPSGAPNGTTFVWTYANNTDAQATLAGGVGVTLTGSVVVPKLTWTQFLVTKTSATAVAVQSFESGSIVSLPPSKLTSQALTIQTTMQVSGMCGAQIANLVLTSAGVTPPVNLALPPAAEVFAAIPNAATGLNYLLIVRNAFTTTQVATVTSGATGATLSGTATIAQAASGMFNISIDSPTTYTATRVGP